MKLTRRKFLRKTSAVGAAFGLNSFMNTLGGCKNMNIKNKKQLFKRCIVLGMDGLDHSLLTQLIKGGKLPNFARLAEKGSYTKLVTSNPAVSPVAWSNIATGTSPECHGIFDFLHRKPKTYTPYLSLRKSHTGLLGTKYKTARNCDGFWKYTSDAGIPTSVIRWPVTFPAEKVNGRFLSGLGTPDVLGSEGQYTYYTTELFSENDPNPDVVNRVVWEDNSIWTFLRGPITNRNEYSKLPLVLKKLSPDSVTIRLADAAIIEAHRRRWTPWIKVAFKVGLRRIHGMVRFLLMETEPHLKLFISPVNMDPSNQAFPITWPAEFGRQLEKEIGPFHTLGMPEMVHPLSYNRYGFDEFLSQVGIIASQRTAMFSNELESFSDGLLAFVFDHTDRMQHAFWAMTDKMHPAYNEAEAKLYGNIIGDTYQQMDEIVGKAMQKIDDETALFVISDHGFGSFRRQVHLNRWLIKNGFMQLKGGNDKEGGGLYKDVDWQKTKAYALGFASVYINLTGREGCGIVKAGLEYEKLCKEIAVKLIEFVDHEKSSAVVHKVYSKNRSITASRLVNDNSPDLLLGLKPGYRFSWQTALGGAPTKLIEDNTSKWTGDHIFDPSFVPGILLSNLTINTNKPGGLDIAPTVLECFGMPKPEHMKGVSLLA